MRTALPPVLVNLLLKRELWREYHRQGDQRAIELLLRETQMDELQDPSRENLLSPELDQKFSAFGREWERAIAIVGLRENAELLEVEVRIQPSLVAQFQMMAEQRLKEPHTWGGLLFVESVLPLLLTPEAWSARAYFIVGKGSSLDELELSSCAGVVSADGPRRAVG